MTGLPADDFYNLRPLESANPLTGGLLTASLPLMESIRNGRFLDLGCYDGEKTIRISRWIHARKSVGVDLAILPIRKAKQRGVDAVLLDFNQEFSLPFPDGSFECIYLGEVIEHVFSPDVLLAEIRRLLSPDGYAVITTPNLASWRNRLVLLLGWQPFGTEVSIKYRVGNPREVPGSPVGHIRMFTPRALMELAERYGLSVDKWAGWAPGRPNDIPTFLSAVIDWVVVKWFPTLCDGLLIKIRKHSASRVRNPDD
jgi:SAM-dependent methyltransferase